MAKSGYCPYLFLLVYLFLVLVAYGDPLAPTIYRNPNTLFVPKGIGEGGFALVQK